jgi:hypothetical protein
MCRVPGLCYEIISVILLVGNFKQLPSFMVTQRKPKSLQMGSEGETIKVLV